jgi:hypothetical protein
MSDFSGPAGKITNANINEGVMWKPEKPAWNIPQIPWGNKPNLAGPQTQQLSKDYESALDFVSILRKEGPRAAYAKYGAGDINALFEAAAGYGLIDPGERESIWAAFNAPAQTGTGAASNTTSILPMAPRAASPVAATGTITEDMALRSGGWINAMENQWAAGNLVEPQPRWFKTNADYKKAYAEWRDKH